MGDTVDFSGWMFTQKMCGFRGFLDSVRNSAKTLGFYPPMEDHLWLVVSNMNFMFHFIYGMSSQPH
jgi:hypothetical protein